MNIFCYLQGILVYITLFPLNYVYFLLFYFPLLHVSKTQEEISKISQESIFLLPTANTLIHSILQSCLMYVRLCTIYLNSDTSNSPGK